MSQQTAQFQTLAELTDQLYPEVVAFREELHRFPELSWQEHETINRIERKLRDHGITNISRPLETALVVDFVYDPAAPFVMLRADVDALPIQDEISAPYRSQVPGVCHACGHDGHTAIVLGTALAIHKAKITLPYNLRFVFQPAEEPSDSGAPKMIEKGVLEGVKAALGMHLEPRLPLGTFGLASGWVNMRSDRVDIELSGPGGHSARPSETADLLWIAAKIIQDSYQLVYRGVDMRDSPVVLTFTEIKAGQGYNIIPKDLQMTGTLRFADVTKQAKFLERFRHYLEYLAGDNGCSIELRVKNGAPAIYNDPKLTGRLIENVDHLFWLPADINTEFRTPGGDDFSYYLNHVPGVMVRIGVRTEKTKASLHEGTFDIPAEALKNGVAFFVCQLTNLDLQNVVKS